MGDQAEHRTDTGDGHTKTRRRWGSRAPRAVQRNPALHLTWRVVVFMVGVAIIAGGLAMLAFPGPGWGAIFVGLAVLATEFVWAQRLLAWVKKQAIKLRDRSRDPAVKRRYRAVAATAVVLIAAGVGWYLISYGFQLPEMPTL
ncbi:MAG: TIGR02611 family protein [Carbonactinosporaceae bacterium]